jgi:hypothetical protein
MGWKEGIQHLWRKSSILRFPSNVIEHLLERRSFAGRELA